MKNECKKNNHLYPVFHIKKWIEYGGKKYIKSIKKYGKIKRLDYSFEYYYSLGEHNSILEDKLADFETYISSIIAKIDNASEKIELSGKEIELLKLYCVLCGSRQHFTTEVIKKDELGSYQSNDYLFGLYRSTSQEEVVKITDDIMSVFYKIKNMSDDMETTINPKIIDSEICLLNYTFGLHIAIVRASKPMLCISDRFCIIENTIDSDFLYSYVPISPQTAILLVKTKYFLNSETYNLTKRKKGNDPFLSAVFYLGPNNNYENLLFCSYSEYISYIYKEPKKVTVDKTKRAIVKINKIPDDICREFNAIFCEDGEKILYCDKEELSKAFKMELSFRNISLCQ